ncbi:unnamed protein product [Nesidiocoris tenuis]|uniref:Uncharacterized protein n=1 Tax=Nesidiocoris tenuis TaxID=355587 RepID=A0A6H5FWS7_9HEMI|nr:unnamed protein product [Nesidiocoris tenuis]
MKNVKQKTLLKSQIIYPKHVATVRTSGLRERHHRGEVYPKILGYWMDKFINKSDLNYMMQIL